MISTQISQNAGPPLEDLQGFGTRKPTDVYATTDLVGEGAPVHVDRDFDRDFSVPRVDSLAAQTQSLPSFSHLGGFDFHELDYLQDVVVDSASRYVHPASLSCPTP